MCNRKCMLLFALKTGFYCILKVSMTFLFVNYRVYKYIVSKLNILFFCKKSDPFKVSRQSLVLQKGHFTHTVKTALV